ncbi:MAG: UDP-N-acetylglucosamine 2-epimerase [Euryarchaeota archaeon]|nr:UDP-N-acetylglucosamine 2-epimerase [Euryarchaeota archaeon]
MKKEKRKIAIFTANRAEYGLLYPVIEAIAKHPKLEYYLLISGAHLDENFGYTKHEIEQDGLKIFKELQCELNGDDLYATTQAIGNIIIKLSGILKELKPHFLIVYADRYEGLAAVVTGSQMGIPIAHIEGGDITQGGALDDSIRHAMTKLSHLHFTTNQDAAKRVKKLGEEKWRIYNVGLPSIDLILQGKFALYGEIKKKLPIDIKKPIILFTQHSITTESELVLSQIRPSLEALQYFASKGVQIIITYPNNDAGGKEIIKELQKYKSIKNFVIVPHLGRYYYHGILNLCGRIGEGVCVGNTSSGIKETPAFGCPFVNIGKRQKGRLRSYNVIDVDYNKKQIIKSIEKALYNKEFRNKCKKSYYPYGKGDAGKKIAEILSSIEINKKLIQKKITY